MNINNIKYLVHLLDEKNSDICIKLFDRYEQARLYVVDECFNKKSASSYFIEKIVVK